MRIPILQIDAFTREPFRGNPAGVCPRDAWLPDAVMQAVAAEVNASETAFIVPSEGGKDYRIRFFTPTTEIGLCGHATLASAHAVFTSLRPELDRVVFQAKEHRLEVFREGEALRMVFPRNAVARWDEGLEAVAEAFGARPREVWRAREIVAVFGSEAEVRALAPDLAAIAALDAYGVLATAPGEDSDFVSRFFVPRMGIPEDPVTGATHCTLIPFWAARLGKDRLFARQVSARGGELRCEDLGDRVAITGHAVTVLEGTMQVPD